MPNPTDELDLKQVEEGALEHLTAEAGHVEADLEQAADEASAAAPEAAIRWRPAIATALTTLAAAVMVGGVFLGVAPRFVAGFAGVLGVGLAVAASRLHRPALTYILIVLGIFAIGVVMVVPSGMNHLFSLRGDVQQAITSGKLLRPPTEFTAGWVAISSWILATIGFGAAWTALVLKRPSIAVMIPLPVAAIAGISVSKDTQILSGILAVALFGASLGVLASSQLGGEDEKLPLAYELRRGAGGFAFLAVVTVLLFLAAQTNILFPHPIYDPTLQPQKPKPISLGAVQDRVLFEAGQTTISGPWVLGDLDVYDGQNWLLPPFAENQLKDVPRSGVVDSSLKPGEKATITIRDLTGAVLPGLPNTVGIVASGPHLAYDFRSGNIRLVQGQVRNGFSYVVVSAAAPKVEDLTALGNNLDATTPSSVKRFAKIGPAPPAVVDLIKQAPKTSKWAEFDFLRNWVLENVTATGLGTPASVSIQRVQEMITTKSGTPYEIVAAQAMLARWADIPSRIGYGFDGGDKVGDHLEIRPKHGSAFPEVYFPGYNWVPVIGVPAHARASQSQNVKKSDPQVLPSSDISVLIFIPDQTRSTPPLFEQLRPYVLLALALALVIALVYFSIPIVRKALRRYRQRATAARLGPRAQVAEAYAEWRDHAADFGYAYHSDTPLMFCDRFVSDEEHTQLAWLVTRALWGDMGEDLTNRTAGQAQELSRALRQRLSQARPITVRVAALVSRISLRHPFEVGELATTSPSRRKAA